MSLSLSNIEQVVLGFASKQQLRELVDQWNKEEECLKDNSNCEILEDKSEMLQNLLFKSNGERRLFKNNNVK